MKDINFYISQLPQTLQDLINEYNVHHRIFYKEVMKELILVYKCYICKKIYTDNFWYRSKYCSKVCYYSPGIAYSN